MGNSLKSIGTVLKDALKLFLENDPLKMAGATAFFTMFALPPILIILVQFSVYLSIPKQSGTNCLLACLIFLDRKQCGK